MLRISGSDNTQPGLPSPHFGTFQTKMMHNDARTDSSNVLLLDMQFGRCLRETANTSLHDSLQLSPESSPALIQVCCLPWALQIANSAVPPAHTAQQLEHGLQGLHTLPLTSCPLSTGCTGSDSAATWASLHPMLSQTRPQAAACAAPLGSLLTLLCPAPTHAVFLGLLAASLENPGLP